VVTGLLLVTARGHTGEINDQSLSAVTHVSRSCFCVCRCGVW
jgi:hypothetical protein